MSTSREHSPTSRDPKKTMETKRIKAARQSLAHRAEEKIMQGHARSMTRNIRGCPGVRGDESADSSRDLLDCRASSKNGKGGDPWQEISIRGKRRRSMARDVDRAQESCPRQGSRHIEDVVLTRLGRRSVRGIGEQRVGPKNPMTRAVSK